MNLAPGNDKNFEQIKARHLSKISVWVAGALFFPMLQLFLLGNYAAVAMICFAQLTLLVFSFLLLQQGIYTLGSLFISMLLATIVFYRSLQGGGIDASTSMWFISVAASGLVFLEKKQVIILVGYIALFCCFLFGVTQGWFQNPVSAIQEPTINHLFDVLTNFAVVAGLFSIHNDIFKEQMAIIRKQENALLLQSRLHSMGEMAAGIAHEINNPLSIITVNSELIMANIKSPGFQKENISRYAKKNINTVKRIASIVDSLKKLSHGNLNEEYEEIKVSEVFDEIKTIMISKAKESNLMVDFEIADPEIQFLGSFTLLGQVLLNLMVNSFHAIENQDEKWIRVSCHNSDNTVTIRIKDSGLGISREVARQIFDPFFTTKKVGQGTGLGLSLCRTAIDRMGGKLYINHGSTNTEFVIELPRVLNNEQADASINVA